MDKVRKGVEDRVGFGFQRPPQWVLFLQSPPHSPPAPVAGADEAPIAAAPVSPATPATPVGVVPLHRHTARQGEVDTKAIMDSLFSHQQQVIKLVTGNDRSNQTMISNLRKDMNVQLETINRNLCR